MVDNVDDQSNINQVDQGCPGAGEQAFPILRVKQLIQT